MTAEREPAEKEPARVVSAQKTRAALVAAATELFAEQGLSGPSLDAICARAGFTRGAFYVHFKTREDLIAAVVEEVMGGFIDGILRVGAVGDLTTIIRSFAMIAESGAFPPPGTNVRPHQILEAASRSPKLRAKYHELLARARDRLRAVVESSQAAGQVRADVSPEGVAQMLLALVLGVQVASELEVPHDTLGVTADVLRMLAPT